MLDNDIIEKSEGPTPWVSQIVPIMKENGEIRKCLDSKIINTAIERQCHSSTTPDEVAIDLNGAKVISKFDLKNAFNLFFILFFLFYLFCNLKNQEIITDDYYY